MDIDDRKEAYSRHRLPGMQDDMEEQPDEEVTLSSDGQSCSHSSYYIVSGDV